VFPNEKLIGKKKPQTKAKKKAKMKAEKKAKKGSPYQKAFY
jgi:hypothetical protein